jgi:Phage terminase large subunit
MSDTAVASETAETYRPSAKQSVFHASPAKFRLILGAWGGGKTTMLVWEDIAQSLRHPGSLGVVYRKTYPSLRDTTKKEYLDAIPPALIKTIVRSEGREAIELVNGSQTWFRCLDDFRKLGSTQFDRISVDEAWEISEEDYRTLAYGRLRGKLGPRRMVLATNPPNRSHWLHQEFIDRANESKAVFHFSAEDNRDHLPPDYWDQFKNMPEQWRARFVRGEWGVLSTGAPVFAAFRSDLHVGDFAYSVALPLVRGWDFGFHHPVCVCLQVTATGHVVVLAEIIGQDEDLLAFGNRVVQQTAQLFPAAATNVIDYCDWAGSHASDRGSKEKGLTAVAFLLHEYGIRCRYRKMGIMPGVFKLQQMLESLPLGRPLLRFDRAGCPRLIDAVSGGYVMDPKTDEPKKDNENDHLVDALRYAVIPAALPASSKYAGKPFPRRFQMSSTGVA